MTIAKTKTHMATLTFQGNVGNVLVTLRGGNYEIKPDSFSQGEALMLTKEGGGDVALKSFTVDYSTISVTFSNTDANKLQIPISSDQSSITVSVMGLTDGEVDMSLNSQNTSFTSHQTTSNINF